MNTKKQFAIAVAGAAAIGGSVFAYDSYVFEDALGDHDLVNRLNWTLNDQVPESFPPAVDKTTGANTHPRFFFRKSATVSMPDRDWLELNDFMFTGENCNFDIDLGSATKTLSFFGCVDAAVWVGWNSPNGQTVTLKSGVLASVGGACQHNALRMGAVASARNNLASFVADGSDACVSNLNVSIQSGNTLVSFRNGARFCNSNSYGVSLSGVSNGVFEVTGEGSCWLNFNRGINPNFYLAGASSEAEVSMARFTDGAVLSNVCGTVGNGGAGARLWLDRGRIYPDNMISVGSAATAHHNLLHLSNGSYLGPPEGLSYIRIDIGEKGHDNRMEVLNSTVAGVVDLLVGSQAQACGNSVLWSNVTLSATSCGVQLGGNPQIPTTTCVTNSTMVIEDSVIGTDSVRPLSVCVGVTSGSCGNRLEVRRSTIHFGGSYVGVGGSAVSDVTDQCANVLRVDDHSTVDWDAAHYVGVRLGWNGSDNRLEVDGGSSALARFVAMGDVNRTEDFTTGNTIFVGTDSALTTTTSIVVYPCQNSIVISNGTLVSGTQPVWHQYKSKTRGVTVTDLTTAAEDGVVFDTTLRFIGTARFSSPSQSSLDFDASHKFEFVLPSAPSAQPIIDGGANVTFNGVKGYAFDFRSIGEEGGDYVLAKGFGTLTVNAADRSALTAALAAAETGKRKFTVRLLIRDNQLIARIHPVRGLMMIFR